jgi:UDP-glucose 4-epimerase
VKNEPIVIHGDGEQTRDFIYVKDVAAANVFFATQSPACGIFNVGYGQRITIRALAATICQAAGSSSVIEYAPQRPGDVKHSQADVDKLSTAGFQPHGNFHDGLNATVDFFRDK